MRVSKNFGLLLRWSYSVPLLCYLALIYMIWMLAVPLKSSIQAPNHIQKLKEDPFVIKIKNSNFNSDKTHTSEENTDPAKEIEQKDKTKILYEVFQKADRDRNGKLDVKELASWIRKNIVEHINNAITNNFGLFTLIDVNPRNGMVSWKEYHAYFLKTKGFGSEYLKKHDERHSNLQRSLREQISNDKALWLEAARTNPDALTVDEFLAFTHPESSAANQLAFVEEIYERFDRDGDDYLTENEFATLQNDENDDQFNTQGEHERRKQFRESIDLNKDGKADRRELLNFFAPQNPRYSEHEAEALLSLADNDHDYTLSLEEILAHPDLFLKSKLVDTARSFHDEF